MEKAPACSLSSPELKEYGSKYLEAVLPIYKYIYIYVCITDIFISLWLCVNIHSSFPSSFPPITVQDFGV